MYRIIICLMVAMTACSSGLSINQLVGTYKSDHKFGPDVLIIRADGTYVQTFQSGGKTQTHQGQWRLTNRPDHELEFDNFHFHPALAAHEKKAYGYKDLLGSSPLEDPGLWAVSPRKRVFGAIGLCHGPESEYCYKKNS